MYCKQLKRLQKTTVTHYSKNNHSSNRRYFWYCVIGKGYPVPNNSFRFCTEKMKIKPTLNFITNQVAENGEAIILIGTRLDESQQRAKSIRKHGVKGHRLSKHPLNPSTYTYAPIKELMLEEIWYIINAIPSPWGLTIKYFSKYTLMHLPTIMNVRP